MLKLWNLTCGYHKKNIVKNIHATFERSTITCIIGPNGCGKSTLLKSIVGLSEIQNGTIELDNKSITTDAKKRAQRIAYMSQMHTVPSLPVIKLILHGRFPYLSYPKHYTESDWKCCHEVMEKLGITHLANVSTADLSGGELQKVYLAMTLVSQADAYLFDEPNSFLDVRHQLELLSQIKQLRTDGKIVVAVLHDLNYAMQIADQIIVMNHGQIVATGTPQEIYDSKMIDQIFHVTVQQSYIENMPYYLIKE